MKHFIIYTSLAVVLAVTITIALELSVSGAMLLGMALGGTAGIVGTIQDGVL